MFHHEACMTCGKVLDDDAQIYCSDECSNRDAVSPSISSCSSVLSSPHIDYATGGEVPALVPSALGSALSDYQGRNRYSLSSSSASSVSWSATDEEDNISVGVEDEYSNYLGNSDAQSSIYEGSSKSSSIMYLPKSSRSSGLSYVRRPSSTNHRSTIPQLHRRTSSSSVSGFTQCIPQSAPSIQSPKTADHYSAFGSNFKGDHDHYYSEADREQEQATVSPKAKHTRNRASLPTYFSLLQISSPQRSALISSSVNSNASPPTPKMTLAAGPTALAKLFMTSASPQNTVEATPRGRQRVAGTSRGSHRSQQSRSRSPSRNPSRPPQVVSCEPERRGRLNSRSSVEQVFDWTSQPMPVHRGRPAVRRNSSPLPKTCFDDSSEALSRSGDHTRTRRGRVAMNELEGIGFTAQAPGFGNGRSGLVHRKRESSGRGMTGLVW